ncbi:MAG TPA: hypothetical protein VIJ94_18835 [Caulobacteraceae bacterium]
MKRLVLFALAAIATATVASAWAAPPPPAWASLAARETRTIARIDQAVKANQISGAEADRLRRQLHRVQSLQAYYRKSHGMSAWERRDLERRLKTIDSHIGKRHETHPARTKA